MRQNTSRKEIIMVAVIIIIQTIAFIIAGINKSYLHIDEAFSLGLTNYDRVKINNSDDFYNKWHEKEYYKDYLVINEDEKYDFSKVYENQKNDVHPPFYYLLLRIGMGFHIGEFSKWSGIILNIIIYVFISLFMYLIIRKLLEGKNRYKEKAAICTLMSAITIASVNNAIYIRMYSLATLNIVITTYLHLKLLDEKDTNYKLLTFIAISALVGSLTHYYYLFYLAMLFIMFTIKYLKEKRYKEFSRYFGALAIAGILSIVIFPYSIKHMFFGYRGKGAISNLSNITAFLKSVGKYCLIINRYAFNNIWFFIIIALTIIFIYKKTRKIKIFEEKSIYTKYMLLPSIFYFILVAVSSPWKELRYIVPICGILFILTFFYLEEALSNIASEKIKNIIFILIFVVMLIMPFVSHIKIEVLYKDKKEVVEKFREEHNLPTLYFASGKNVRFQDDILLFTIIDESYVSVDIECNEENIRKIMDGKDLSKGMILFLNDNQDKNQITQNIKNALDLTEIEHYKRLNACDVYYLK